MFCPNCGTQIKDTAQFCQNCGIRLETEEFQEVTIPENPEIWADEETGKKKPLGRIIAAVAIVLAVVAVGAVLFGIFGGASGKVMRALDKSGAAFSTALKDTGLTDVGELLNLKESSQELSVWAEEISGAAELEGIGVRVGLDSSLPDRKIGLDVTPYFGSADLVNLKLQIADDKIYIGSPELTKDTCYMMSTATIGEDLGNLMDMGMLADLSFNLFDLVEQAQQINDTNQETTKAAETALEDFSKTIEVKRNGSETLEVNGNDLKCTAYQVVIPEESLNALLDALEDAYSFVNNTDAWMDLVGSMGLPGELTEELENALAEGASGVNDGFEMLREALDELGDVELALYINKGYVVAAVYEAHIDGTEVKFIINVGGGEEYLNDISLRIVTEHGELAIVSSGNHTGADGTFTDGTMIQMDEEMLLMWKLSYAPKAETDNFSWELRSDGVEVTVAGQIVCTDKALSAQLEEIKLNQDVSIGIAYEIGKYEADDTTSARTVALADLDEDELSEELNVLTGNLTDWLWDKLETYPDLIYYFF